MRGRETERGKGGAGVPANRRAAAPKGLRSESGATPGLVLQRGCSPQPGQAVSFTRFYSTA